MKTSGSCSWDDFFTLVRSLGFAPQTALDVGANRGNWTREAFRHFPATEFVLIEPQRELEQYAEELRRTGCKLRWINSGVSDRAGLLPLTIAPDDTSSNFGMTPEAAQAYGYRQEMVEIRTIDSILERLNAPTPDMVKIDAEGFDLKALAGASRLIGKTDIFFLEAAVCATGIENTMATVIGTMDRYGYKMVDVTDLNRSPKHGVLWLCELVFLRKNSPLLGKVSSYQ